MDSSLLKKKNLKVRRALRVRKFLKGSEAKPRLSVIKSNKHVHIQLIDDDSSKTITSISTMSKEFGKKNKETAKKLGLKIAELSKAKNVKKVVFDRGPYKYHGVIAAVAEGAREGGLEL